MVNHPSSILAYISHAVLPIFLRIGFTTLIIALEFLLGWERLSLFGRFGYVEMIKCLMIKILLSCRSTTVILVCSVYGHLSNGWRTATCLRELYTIRGHNEAYFFPNMGGRIIYGLVHQPLMRFAVAHFDM
jgi:hypothetical protein